MANKTRSMNVLFFFFTVGAENVETGLSSVIQKVRGAASVESNPLRRSVPDTGCSKHIIRKLHSEETTARAASHSLFHQLHSFQLFSVFSYHPPFQVMRSLVAKHLNMWRLHSEWGGDDLWGFEWVASLTTAEQPFASLSPTADSAPLLMLR